MHANERTASWVEPRWGAWLAVSGGLRSLFVGRWRGGVRTGTGQAPAGSGQRGARFIRSAVLKVGVGFADRFHRIGRERVLRAVEEKQSQRVLKLVVGFPEGLGALGAGSQHSDQGCVHRGSQFSGCGWLGAHGVPQLLGVWLSATKVHVRPDASPLWTRQQGDLRGDG
jgi:hypothetical protein